MNRILVVEDEPRITSFLKKGLQANGFVVTVAEDGAGALALARDDWFDLVILDLGLPDMDGQSVVRGIRSAGARMPVIILTARIDLNQTVAGLEGGADDYITKPFSFEELLARVRARLRDRGSAPANVLEAGKVRLDLHSRQVHIDGRPVELSAREFLLAETLVRHQGQVLSREQLLSRVWGFDYDPGSNLVDVYVGYLRKKFGVGVIETVRGVGYRLAEGMK